MEPLEEEKKKKVYDYIRDKYANDFSDEARQAKVDEANAKNSSLKMGLSQGFAGLGQALQAKAGSGKGIDTSYFDKLRDKNREEIVGEFDKQKAGVMDEFKRDEALNAAEKNADRSDPSSEYSQTFIANAKKSFPQLGEKLDGMSVEQAEKLIPTLTQQLEAQTNRDFQKTQKYLDRKNARDINNSKIAASNAKKTSAMTEGQKKVDQDYAKHYNEFSGSGAANAKKTIEQLKAFRDELLAEEKHLFQSGGGRIGSMLPDVMRTDQSLVWKKDIPAKANLVLKKLFGGQLSDNERKSESETYYDDMLGPKENAIKLNAKIAQLEAGYENELRKAQYYEEKGTLQGFEGVVDQTEEKEAPQEETTQVRDPNTGRIKNIPQSMVKAALASGGTLVDQPQGARPSSGRMY